MKKLSILLFALSCPLFFTNMLCQNIKGNGNVVEKERSVEDFSAISVKEGVDLFLTQSENNKVTVATDENLQEYIITKVEKGTLEIYPKNNINATKITVKVEFKNISALSAAEGVDVETTSPVSLDNLAISLVEGSDCKLDITVKNLACSVVEGSDMKLKGTIKSLSLSIVEGSEIDADITVKELACSIVEGSEVSLKGTCQNSTFSIDEGSEVKAFDMVTENCTVSANEGSEAEINVTKSLIVAAEGGSEVAYRGNPTEKQISSCEDCEVKAQ